jgi:hypothetical protein
MSSYGTLLLWILRHSVGFPLADTYDVLYYFSKYFTDSPTLDVTIEKIIIVVVRVSTYLAYRYLVELLPRNNNNMNNIMAGGADTTTSSPPFHSLKKCALSNLLQPLAKIDSGQLLAIFECFLNDLLDGWIDSDKSHIPRNLITVLPRVEKGFVCHDYSDYQ